MTRLFQKGNQAAKGHGRPPAPPDLKGVTYLTQDYVKRQIAVFMDTPLIELRAIAADPNEPALRALTAQIICNAYDEGDHQRLDFLFNRCIGKVKEERDVNINVTQLPSREEAIKILEADYAMLPAPDVEVEEL